MVLTRLLAIALIMLWCRPVLAMDLMDLYREAKANDARFAAANAQFRVMQERVPLAKAGVAPAAALDANTSVVRAGTGTAPTSYGLQQSHYNARDDTKAATGVSAWIQPVRPK